MQVPEGDARGSRSWSWRRSWRPSCGRTGIPGCSPVASLAAAPPRPSTKQTGMKCGA